MLVRWIGQELHYYVKIQFVNLSKHKVISEMMLKYLSKMLYTHHCNSNLYLKTNISFEFPCESRLREVRQRRYRDGSSNEQT